MISIPDETDEQGHRAPAASSAVWLSPAQVNALEEAGGSVMEALSSVRSAHLVDAKVAVNMLDDIDEESAPLETLEERMKLIEAAETCLLKICSNTGDAGALPLSSAALDAMIAQFGGCPLLQNSLKSIKDRSAEQTIDSKLEHVTVASANLQEVVGSCPPESVTMLRGKLISISENYLFASSGDSNKAEERPEFLLQEGAWHGVGWPSHHGVFTSDSLGVLSSPLVQRWEVVMQWLGGVQAELTTDVASECVMSIANRFVSFLQLPPNIERLPINVALTAYGHMICLVRLVEECNLFEKAHRLVSQIADGFLSAAVSASIEELHCFTVSYRGDNRGILKKCRTLNKVWSESLPEVLMKDILYFVVFEEGLGPLVSNLMENQQLISSYRKGLSELHAKMEGMCGVVLPACATLNSLLLV